MTASFQAFDLCRNHPGEHGVFASREKPLEMALSSSTIGGDRFRSREESSATIDAGSFACLPCFAQIIVSRKRV